MSAMRGIRSSLSMLLLIADLSPGLFAQPALPGSPVLSVEADQLFWTSVPSATGYDLVRGSVNVLLQSGGDFTAATRLCLADDTPSLALHYAGAPKLGEAYWFLVRPTTSTEAGTYDSGGAGQVGSRDAEIEAAPTACFSPVLPHAPIAIAGNTDFTAANGVVGGSGTIADPYLISGWNIVCPSKTGTRGIQIGGTTAPFVIRNVKAQSCELGILLSSAQNGRVERAMAADILTGVGVSSGQDITIDGCRVSYQLGVGVGASSSTNIVIERNRLEFGLVGINLNNCSGCSVYGNNVLSNMNQGIEQGFGANPNFWDLGYPGGGNYWSDYQGVDVCQGPAQNDCSAPDGFGDTPVFVNSSKTDRYPRMVADFAEGDDVPPTVAITSPPDGSEVTTDPFTVTGTAADAGSGVRRVEVSQNGGPWMIASGTTSWSIPVSPVGGTNSLSVRSIDHAGLLSATSALTVTYQAPVWEATLQTDKTTYAPGEPVAIIFQLTNHTSHAVTLDFPTTCQSFFSVQDASGTPVYDQRQHVGCFDVLTQRTWQPDEIVTYNFTWSQVNDAGQQVPAASYQIRGFMDSLEAAPDGLSTISITP